MSQHNPILETANIRWHGDTPVNEQFGDRYFSEQNGVEESRYVFLNGNDLPMRWDQAARDDPVFSILETGFGSGLNFLVTAEAWLEYQASASQPCLEKLIYTSIEGFPLSQQDLDRIIQSWPEQFRASNFLVDNFPPPIEGIYNLDFGSIELRIMQMPIARALAEFEPKGAPFADCLYLDGFAPSKNEQMWRETILRQLSFLCRDGGTFSTFTAVGNVRRSLIHAGFDVEKIKGFGRKREMLTGVMRRSTPPDYKPRAPWFHFEPAKKTPEDPVIIIGAGVAGCATAFALARNGVACQILDAGETPGGTLCDFPASIYSPMISADFNLASQFYFHGFTRLAGYLSNHQDVIHNPCGVFHIAQTPERESLLRDTLHKFRAGGLDIHWLDAHQTGSHIGLSLDHPGLLINHGGSINARSLCQSLMTHPLISTNFNTRVDSINYMQQDWEIQTDQQTFQSGQVILCSGQDTTLIDQYWSGSLDKIKGQSTLATETANMGDLATIVNNGHYVLPAVPGQGMVMGSSYETDYNNPDQACIETDIENLSAATGIHPELDHSIARQIASLATARKSDSPVGMRLMSRDRLPLVGPVPDFAFYREHYTDVIPDGRLKYCPLPRYWPSLFLNTAHGSRGITASLISASLIAAMISGRPFPLPTRLYRAVHPARFFVRERIKG